MGGLTLVNKAREAGLHLEAADGRLVIHGPRRAEPVARELLAHKAEVLAALAEAPTPPDPTPPPAPCSACGSLVYWRPFGDDRLRCQGCEPCPKASGAAWYGATTANDPLAEILDPDARAAMLWWYAQGHPEIADEESRVLRRLENPGAGPDVRADLLRLVDRVRELRAAYWLAPNE